MGLVLTLKARKGERLRGRRCSAGSRQGISMQGITLSTCGSRTSGSVSKACWHNTGFVSRGEKKRARVNRGGVRGWLGRKPACRKGL